MLVEKIVSKINKVHSTLREKSKSRKRSSHWDETRDSFLEKHPLCEACGRDKHLQVHHVAPFHLHPELELLESNLITLCMDEYDCHLKIGHGDSFQCYNPNVREDAENFFHASSDIRKLIVENARQKRLK